MFLIQLCLHFSRFPPLTDVALRRNLANNSFVFIAGSFLLQFKKKLVNGLSKSVMGAAIKNTGHPGRRFLAASPLVFAASPLHSRSKNSLNRQATQAIAPSVFPFPWYFAPITRPKPYSKTDDFFFLKSVCICCLCFSRLDISRLNLNQYYFVFNLNHTDGDSLKLPVADNTRLNSFILNYIFLLMAFSY